MKLADLEKNGHNGHNGHANGVPAAALLDVRPIAAPKSPFAWMAEKLRADDYKSEAEAQQALGLVRWFDRLARALPDVSSVDPIFLSACSRAAVDWRYRESLRTALDAIEREAAAAAAAEAAKKA